MNHERRVNEIKIKVTYNERKRHRGLSYLKNEASLNSVSFVNFTLVSLVNFSLEPCKYFI